MFRRKSREGISNDPEHNGLREPGQSAMENTSELLSEPSSSQSSLIMRNRLCQKASRWNGSSVMSHSIIPTLPADRQFLRHSQTALTWNLVSLYFCCNRSRLTARKADGSAGRGNLKKRTPSCNGKDRGKAEIVVTAVEADALTRKGADFRYRSGSVMQTSNLL